MPGAFICFPKAKKYRASIPDLSLTRGHISTIAQGSWCDPAGAGTSDHPFITTALVNKKPTFTLRWVYTQQTESASKKPSLTSQSRREPGKKVRPPWTWRKPLTRSCKKPSKSRYHGLNHMPDARDGGLQRSPNSKSRWPPTSETEYRTSPPPKREEGTSKEPTGGERRSGKLNASTGKVRSNGATEETSTKR